MTVGDEIEMAPPTTGSLDDDDEELIVEATTWLLEKAHPDMEKIGAETHAAPPEIDAPFQTKDDTEMVVFIIEISKAPHEDEAWLLMNVLDVMFKKPSPSWIFPLSMANAPPLLDLSAPEGSITELFSNRESDTWTRGDRTRIAPPCVPTAFVLVVAVLFTNEQL